MENIFESFLAGTTKFTIDATLKTKRIKSRGRDACVSVCGRNRRKTSKNATGVFFAIFVAILGVYRME